MTLIAKSGFDRDSRERTFIQSALLRGPPDSEFSHKLANRPAVALTERSAQMDWMNANTLRNLGNREPLLEPRAQ